MNLPRSLSGKLEWLRRGGFETRPYKQGARLLTMRASLIGDAHSAVDEVASRVCLYVHNNIITSSKFKILEPAEWAGRKSAIDLYQSRFRIAFRGELCVAW